MEHFADLTRRLAICAMLILAAASLVWSADAPPSTQPAGDNSAAAKQSKRERARVAPSAPHAKAPATQPDKPAQHQPAKAQAAPNIAHIALRGEVLSSPPEFSFFAGQTQGMTLREWLQRLAKARNDENIQAVALEVDSPEMNWAQAQELADAVLRLSAVKCVYAHMTSGGAVSYLVASAGRELTMDPAGELTITGLATEMMFFRGTLDWIGVEPQLFQIGRYKGAAEPMTRTGPSDELKDEYGRILDDLYDQLCGQIARQRGLTVPHVRNAVDNGPFSAQSARQYNLVNGLVERAAWKQHVVDKVTAKGAASALWHADYGAKEPQKLDFGNPFAVLGMLMGAKAEPATKDPTVAIIHADGVIVDGQSASGFFGGQMVGDRTMIHCFEQVAKDDNVKAVIFRIDSPGGSALASEMIYQAVRKCAAKKPVVASIVGVGGSGGYYIALGAQKIIADPSAITGSIGVVGGKLATTGLMAKLGISTHVISRGQNAGLWTSRPWDDREQKIVKDLMERTYRTFTSRVRQGRGPRVKDIDAVAQGRVFTARQAVTNGLIDEVGGLREALLAAHKAAGIESSNILVLPRPKTLADVLTGDGTSSFTPMRADGAAIRSLLAEAPGILAAGRDDLQGVSYLLTLGELLSRRCVLTAMPYHVSIKP